MNTTILELHGKPLFAVVPFDEYVALLELADDVEDTAAQIAFAKRYAKGEARTIPAPVVDRLLAGESPVRVWREHRGMTARKLAELVSVTPAHVSRLESGKGEPSVPLLRKLAKALDVDIDLLVGPA